MPGGERRRELRRRRHRKEKLDHFKARLKKASASEKAVIAGKLRKMTPGAEVIIATYKLEKK
jgi:hypothetical protein